MISTFRFKKALASRDEVIVTGPYLDQWGSGHVITISKAIVKTLAFANLKKTFSKEMLWIWYRVLKYQNLSKTEKYRMIWTNRLLHRTMFHHIHIPFPESQNIIPLLLGSWRLTFPSLISINCWLILTQFAKNFQQGLSTHIGLVL